MKTEEIIISQIVTQTNRKESISFNNRCSCYDSECRDVVNHFICFMGDEYVGGVAYGYCPWLV